MLVSLPTRSGPSLASLQAHFLAVLPRIEQHARVYFRHLRCSHARADAIAETIALCWAWYVRAIRQGKDVDEFISALATYAVRHVRCGRKLCGQERTKDALSPSAQTRYSFTISSLPNASRLNSNIFDEALRDNTQTEVPDQAHFRCEMPRWLTSLGERNSRIALDLMIGERTGTVAHRHGLSPARVAQLRREFRDGWQQFSGELAVV
jgi:hypothetical protein